METFEHLLTAYEKHDAHSFAGICVRLQQSKDDRQKTANNLLQLISESDPYRAEIAVNTLRFSGLALEDKWHKHLVAVAERLFTAEFLSKLVAIETLHKQGTNHRPSPELRLLRSVLRALTRKKDMRAMTLVDTIAGQLAETPLAAKIIEWKQPSEDQE